MTIEKLILNALSDKVKETFDGSRMTEEECEESVLEDFLQWLITKYRNEKDGPRR